MMPVQRTRDAENRGRNKLSNGPLRVQSNADTAFCYTELSYRSPVFCKVFCNVQAYVSCRGYVGILLSVRKFFRKSRWHRG
jgi:hypothetical protein